MNARPCFGGGEKRATRTSKYMLMMLVSIIVKPSRVTTSSEYRFELNKFAMFRLASCTAISPQAMFKHRATLITRATLIACHFQKVLFIQILPYFRHEKFIRYRRHSPSWEHSPCVYCRSWWQSTPASQSSNRMRVSLSFARHRSISAAR